MPKERSVNPAQAQRKAEKAKAIKKGKAGALTRRTEKLARRNPERLQKQLDDLRALESSGGKLTSHEQKILEELERDVKAVRKAREALGDKAPSFGAGRRDTREEGIGGGARGGGHILGKRRRDENGDEMSSDESDIAEDVRRIPMPRDTPPPIPKEVLDRWYQARRERNGHIQAARHNHGPSTSANNIPLGSNARIRQDPSSDNVLTMPLPRVEAKTVYEAAPAIRDLRREAVSAFVPAAVRMKIQKAKGAGGLVEPEEADRLEMEGYSLGNTGAGKGQGEGEEHGGINVNLDVNREFDRRLGLQDGEESTRIAKGKATERIY